MLCRFIRQIYPKPHAADASGYTVAAYQSLERVVDADGSAVRQVKVVGYYLPTAPGIDYRLKGHWTKSSYGPQFELESYEEIFQHNREGLIGYLSSGLIKGIGPKLAETLYNTFGEKVLEVLDSEPEQLLDIPGVGAKKLERIIESCAISRGAREIISFLAPFGIMARRAIQIQKFFGAQAATIVRQYPYRLVEMRGIGFETADRIAQSVGIPKISPMRADAALLFTLEAAEGSGHLCLSTIDFLKAAQKLLDTEGITEHMLAVRADWMLQAGSIALYNGRVYRRKTAAAEQAVADGIFSLLNSTLPHIAGNLDTEIDKEQLAIGKTLAPEQREAVKTCLTSPLCIISGGPGTGKTLIQRVFLGIYKRLQPEANIVCCAPTGRAARRMEECTGLPASTIHKALGILSQEPDEDEDETTLTADMVLVDEVSMLDIFLAKRLLGKLPPDCRLILIGDADQLPSVGPGAVLSELIASGKIPTVMLKKVFRQSEGSRIAVNAAHIRGSRTALEYGEGFHLLESDDMETSVKMIRSLYRHEAVNRGLDNVTLLSPYRKNSATGVNALNDLLRDDINPPNHEKPEVTFMKRVFRLGDKVMQTKNKGDVSNGDVGYITAIHETCDGLVTQVDFKDGRLMEYEQSDLDQLDLAYATTIHKSQGSEYDSVIISLQYAHFIMLKRPLLYTAITRAKKQVVIVGERKAVAMAIRTADTEKRGTLLADRLQRLSLPAAANE